MIEETLLTDKGESQNILLVEGIDDVLVMRSLFDHYHIPYVYRGLPEYEQMPPELIEIRNPEGIENLLTALDVELKRSGEKRLGVVVDADRNLSNRWASLRDRLRRAGYGVVPGNPQPDGTIIVQDEKFPVGLWLMPDNQLPGMLEDFASLLVPPGDLLWPVAERTLQEVIATERRFPDVHQSKARIYTWLAWQKKPGKPIGQAITSHYLDPSAPRAQQFIAWVRRLFA
ncbi:MAG TPA: DUF3226 domain-containing protein [Ktedonobacteraceae bacterium]|nr:DUF3226 domain-containing protein [Ktedonobacteraceae bacterium]